MTNEQYNRAVEINQRLEELEAVKKEINDYSKYLLTYCEADDYKPCYRWTMVYISDILDRHDKMIREEMENEIKNLKDEIKTL